MSKSKNLKTLTIVAMLLVFASATILVNTGAVFADDAKPEVKSEVKDETKAKTKADKAAKDVKPSDKKGKFFFKKSCKSCHGKKGDGGEVTPVSKTIKQWERFFRKDKHGEKKVSEEFDAIQLIHIKAFLINHAADSDQPETCG